jgi:hypothetical protein
MGVFSADEIEVLGKRAIRLAYRLNEFDRTPRTITLIAAEALAGYTRFPAAYQYLEASSERRYPIIRVIAAPGVSVLLQNFPDVWIAGQEVPDLEIYRVQDPEVVPPLACDIQAFTLTGSDEVNPPSSTLIVGPPTDNYFQVERAPSQVIIRHPFSHSALIIRVPQLSRNPSETRDARARFAYEFDPNGVLGHADRPLLKIVKTPEVEIELATRVLRLPSERIDARQLFAFWQIYEVDNINAVPPQGYTITPEAGWREVRSLPRVPPLEEELAMAAFDISLGAIPVVGDIVDIAELIYGLVAGRDRWGRRVGAGDLVIMGIGALIPLVGSAALRNASRLTRVFGRRAQTVEDLVEALRRATLTAEEADLIRAMERLIREGRHPTAEMLQRFSELLRRVQGDYPSLEILLNAERIGFIHPQLQEAYQGYRQGQVRAGRRPASPQEWAIRVTSGSPRRILVALLGPDYARGARRVRTARFINLGDIPRPRGYGDAQLQAHIEVLLREPAKLTERLGALIAERTTGGPITRFLARLRVNSGRFRILKGNVAEIFSLATQRRILRELRSVEPNARLITGVRMRLMSEQGQLARSVLFTDNIIAVERGGNLHVLAVFEVKSGYEGGLEATSQIFRWIEERITDGSQLVIPSGARVLAADGTEQVVSRARTFTYNPDRTDVPRVVNIVAADRHIVAARGSSHLGIDSPDQVGARVTRHTLDMSSAELDYLVGRLLASLDI